MRAKELRLLLVTQQLRDFTSGLGTYARGLVEGLSQEGAEVTVAVPRAQTAEIEGARIVPLTFEPGNVTPFSRRRMSREIGRVLGSVESDLVHFLDAREAGLARMPMSTPVIGTVHDTYAVDWLDPEFPRRLYEDRVKRGFYYRWLRRIERAAYRRLDRAVTNSRHVARTIETAYGVARDRTRVVRIGLPDRPEAAPEPLEGDPAVLFVGGNYQRKGLVTLLPALAIASRTHPGIRLHVVGKDAKAPSFLRIAARLGVAERVEFHGWRPNDRVRGMMAGAGVFAMPSLVEAFGLVYLEAMRAGVPVIGTTKGGASELLTDGEDALLAPPGDVDALASILGRLAGDGALRERLVRGGTETVGRMTLAATVAETRAVYAEVV